MKKIPTRAQRAGAKMAESIIEMINLMYQDNTAIKFLRSLNDILSMEYCIRVTKAAEGSSSETEG